MITSGVGLLKRDIARHEVEVSLELADDLPRVIADPVLIEQVVVNLVRNACDAMAGQEGPRRIRIHAEALGHATSGPSVLAMPPVVRVSVSDSGPGLNGQTVATLCAPFFTTKSDGMGMGLAICRSILELHYGALDASESPSGGAMFAFSLPTTDNDPHTDTASHTDTDTENTA